MHFLVNLFLNLVVRNFFEVLPQTFTIIFFETYMAEESERIVQPEEAGRTRRHHILFFNPRKKREMNY